MPRTRAASGNEPIRAARILTTAVDLTAREGLDAVTMRRLAAELGTWPAAIYHHVGDRDAVHDAVTEWVVNQVPLPDDRLAWRPWFTTLLGDLRAILRSHPGVARRLMLRGATVPSALRIIDRGVALLANAGFGDEAPAAYGLMLGYSVQYVAMEDDLPQHTRERVAMRELYRSFADYPSRPGLAQAATSFPSMTGDEVFSYGLERILDGLDARRRSLRRGGRAVH